MPRMKTAVVIPCFRVSDKILKVIKNIDSQIDKIIIVDDKCPDKTGKLVKNLNRNKKIKVIFNNTNLGVGGSTIKGFEYAFDKEDVDICIKIDGDGQMDTRKIKNFVKEFTKKKILYVKGNRFHFNKSLIKMPIVRLIGNFFLSIISKFTTGYYNVFDITNGFIATNKKTWKLIDKNKLSKDFFFETSIVACLRLLKCKIKEIKIKTIYGNEKSNLIIKQILFKFIKNHIYIFFRRIYYEYIKTKNILFFTIFINFIFSVFFIFIYINYIFMSFIICFIFYYFDKKFLKTIN